ncbi:MAG: hypothetical protein QOJ23_1503, partial [Actinomycetota bacterium]|nr:hypothetical protein [Actinomycetota bacterium]
MSRKGMAVDPQRFLEHLWALLAE